MSKFYKKLFLLMLVFSTLFSVSANNWFMMWIGMEMNLLSIIPLFKNNNIYPTEASIKYFITQCLASSILLVSILVMENNMMTSYLYLTHLALLIKLGAAPFHFWMPEVIEGLNWMNCLIVLTWQKIAPSVLLMMTFKLTNLITSSMFLSSLIGGLLALNQNSMRKIMAFSSINHTAWMLASMLSYTKMWMIYFSVYSIMNIFIITIFNKFNIFYINQLNSVDLKSIKYLIMLNILSLAGLPPLVGFMPKWLVIYELTKLNMIIISFILMITTLISIFMYLRMITPTLMLKTKNKLMKIEVKVNFIINSMNILFLSSLVLAELMF
uniref:NADH-ubiquinone oxidoreductase chain 2 n=1 Tax=Rhadinosa nigrocyanea TaxID=2093842 RepID=A0A343UQ99_9CUCU|nr:NADH dehydrogenase subunit 2 [Rhadinosa nigrocyanea]AVF96874.1 NADH dehydrogenase subunit 2 [Rhadinosa nigrocyanea]